MLNWYYLIIIDVAEKILTKYKTEFRIDTQDKGPLPQWQGHGKAKCSFQRAGKLSELIDSSEVMDRGGKWDKAIQRYGNTILRKRDMKIQRMAFVVQETGCLPALPASGRSPNSDQRVDVEANQGRTSGCT